MSRTEILPKSQFDQLTPAPGRAVVQVQRGRTQRALADVRGILADLQKIQLELEAEGIVTVHDAIAAARQELVQGLEGMTHAAKAPGRESFSRRGD